VKIQMGRFLDLRISENSSTFGSPGTGVATAPTMVGIIGLQTQGVAGTGTNGLIVHLAGTVGVSAAAAATIVLNVQRGAGAFGAAGSVVIYTADHMVTVATGANLISLTASDITAPATIETIYQLFISSVTVVGVVTRVGPENFAGIAQNGLAATP
jgi:hypothetical protein